ncbi:MAG: hypothetical protein LBG30_03955 [Odoribacteraceae bacterium]|jgi:hypothetical protein|nr:hypothetical protein [Odoribacteraceae bacterium]
MIVISSTEFRNDLNKYLDEALCQDVIIHRGRTETFALSASKEVASIHSEEEWDRFLESSEGKSYAIIPVVDEETRERHEQELLNGNAVERSCRMSASGYQGPAVAVRCSYPDPRVEEAIAESELKSRLAKSLKRRV